MPLYAVCKGSFTNRNPQPAKEVKWVLKMGVGDRFGRGCQGDAHKLFYIIDKETTRCRRNGEPLAGAI